MRARTLLSLSAALSLSALAAGCASKPTGQIAAQPQSSIGSYLTSGPKKVAALFEKKHPSSTMDTPAPGPLKPSPDLFLAVARVAEESGNFPEAEKQYNLAIKADPKDYNSLVGLAHLYDRQGKLDEATKQYQKAIAKHPEQAGAHNDLGLCFHRRGMIKESIPEFNKAVALKPDRALYHNNLATVYVDAGQMDQALAQLKMVDRDAVAHHNLGCLLHQKGDDRRAIEQFQLAAASDPSFDPPQAFLAKLGAPVGPQLAAGRGPSASPIPTSPYAQAQAQAQAAAMPRVSAMPQVGARPATPTMIPAARTLRSTTPEPARPPQFLKGRAPSDELADEAPGAVGKSDFDV